MKRVRLLHVTEFAYDAPVSESYNEVHLRPRDDDWQSCTTFRLTTRPRALTQAFRDYFGNWVHHVSVLPPHRTLRVEAESIVLLQETAAAASADVSLAEVDQGRNALLEEHYDYLVPSVYVPALAELRPLVAAVAADSGPGAAAFVRAATAFIKARFRYEKGATHVHSSVADVLGTGAGVCQDFAHLLLGIARERGFPARYVSGYVVPPQEGAEAAALEAVAGGLASHAWAEVFVPGLGWLGLDPTLGAPVGAQHVRLAYGRDYADVPPVRGVHRGQAGQHLSVDVRVRPALDDEGTEHRGEPLVAPEPVRAANAPQQ